MRITILGRNKLGFIDGTCVKEGFGPNLTALWERCNAIVLSWIMNCVSKELLGGIVYSTNAAAVWSDLKERYDKVDGSRIYQLYKEIASISQVSIRSGTNPVNRQKILYSPYSYDPNVTCDHCKRKGHSKANCFRLVGYPPNFEKRRRENQVNNYSDKGNYYSERGGNTYNTTNNVVNSPVKTQEQANHFSRNVDYNKGMEGTQDMSTSTHGPISGSANSMQSSNTADSGATSHMTYKSDMLVQKKSIPFNNCNEVYLPNGDTTIDLYNGQVKVIGRESNGLYILPAPKQRNKSTTHIQSHNA
ncbi:hypothetical protein KY284_024358 [Solanum tuberosum]|nr:hypothetical protein KY284_024358 [Solanum tuberosum]